MPFIYHAQSQVLEKGKEKEPLIIVILDIDDLYQTGKSIQSACINSKTAGLSDTRLKALATAYHSYSTSQTHSNFHGIFILLLWFFSSSYSF